jgi:hypothetical protein
MQAGREKGRKRVGKVFFFFKDFLFKSFQLFKLLTLSKSSKHFFKKTFKAFKTSHKHS